MFVHQNIKVKLINVRFVLGRFSSFAVIEATVTRIPWKCQVYFYYGSKVITFIHRPIIGKTKNFFYVM